MSASAAHARTWTASVLSQLGADERVVADVALVVSELVANAIHHGPPGTISVSLAELPGVWQVTVTSPTVPDRDPATWSVADPNRPAGRGLGIVRALVDDVVVDHVASCVTCRVARPGR